MFMVLKVQNPWERRTFSRNSLLVKVDNQPPHLLVLCKMVLLFDLRVGGPGKAKQVVRSHHLHVLCLHTHRVIIQQRASSKKPILAMLSTFEASWLTLRAKYETNPAICISTMSRRWWFWRIWQGSVSRHGPQDTVNPLREHRCRLENTVRVCF